MNTLVSVKEVTSRESKPRPAEDTAFWATARDTTGTKTPTIMRRRKTARMMARITSWRLVSLLKQYRGS